MGLGNRIISSIQGWLSVLGPQSAPHKIYVSPLILLPTFAATLLVLVLLVDVLYYFWDPNDLRRFPAPSCRLHELVVSIPLSYAEAFTSSSERPPTIGSYRSHSTEAYILRRSKGSGRYLWPQISNRQECLLQDHFRRRSRKPSEHARQGGACEKKTVHLQCIFSAQCEQHGTKLQQQARHLISDNG
jgi:hypothetical protein